MTEKIYNLTDKKVWVAGHRGMVGSAVVRRLAREPVMEVITATSSEVDLRRQQETEDFVRDTSPDLVVLAAAHVGGIQANRTAQSDFLYDNLMIAANVLQASHQHGVEKVVVLGSSCIYPRDTSQPIPEEALLTGALEPTNEGYAIAKIAALELGKMMRRQHEFDVISLMPTNLYGPGDNYDYVGSHVLPALLRKVHDAKVASDSQVTIWGTGEPMREFLHVDDLADAVIFTSEQYSGEQHLNVGTGRDISIRNLAAMISEVVGWTGTFVFDTSMPDGTPRKLLDVSAMERIGWSSTTELREGIASTYENMLALPLQEPTQ